MVEQHNCIKVFSFITSFAVLSVGAPIRLIYHLLCHLHFLFLFSSPLKATGNISLLAHIDMEESSIRGIDQRNRALVATLALACNIHSILEDIFFAMETTVISVSWPVTCLTGCLSYAFNNTKMHCELHVSMWVAAFSSPDLGQDSESIT